MTYTYTLGTSIAAVRRLIPDRVQADAVWTDEEIQDALNSALNGGNAYRAAAELLEAMASDEAYVQKKTRMLEFQTDGPAVSDALLKRALLLRQQAAEQESTESGGDFDIAEIVTGPFSRRERLWDEALRQGM